MKKEDIEWVSIPQESGVYIFEHKKKPLYIGKATSLRSRVRSYFSRLEETRGPIVKEAVDRASNVRTISTDGPLEALLLEAFLIKKHSPKYNSILKDDKSFPFVIITDEEFPRIRVVRGRDIEKKKYKTKAIYGPFPKGKIIQEAMRIIRRLFPFSDTCKPNTRACLRRQIGLCPGICSGEITKREYARRIKYISLLFEGKKDTIYKSIEKEMDAYAKKEEFEKAGECKRKLIALTHIQDATLIRKDFVEGVEDSFRIEGYDVAHTAGSETVGVMVAMVDGELDKSSYRKFKIMKAKGGDDLASLEEVLTRRFSHLEWEFPGLVVIDGGKTHLSRAKKVLDSMDILIPLVSVVKDEKHNPKGVLGDPTSVTSREAEILLVNNEAHRYALSWHRKRRDKINR